MDWNFLIQNRNALSVTTDTRILQAGDVFFALRGENFNGNAFANDALNKGASLVVMDDREAFDAMSDKSKIIWVQDTTAALQELARTWRRYLRTPLLAITGTNGKTTTKELIATVLQTKYRVHFTQGNLNNGIGVPLTLLQLKREHELGIIEMGASHQGEIKTLATIAEPNCGLITNVGKAHLGGFGSFEGVVTTKKELYDYLREHDGFIFRNADNSFLSEMAGNLRSILYTTGTMPARTHLVGDYNAENVSAAICVGEYKGISRQEALTAIQNYIPKNNRSMRIDTDKNVVIMDAYNANPSSMKVALDSFDGDAFILGTMAELGDYSITEHQNVVNRLAEQREKCVFLVGNDFKKTTTAYPVFETVEDLGKYLIANPLTNKKILVKGSRKNKLEKIVKYI